LPAAIGRYRVERLLGRGAMGVIYQAHDPVIDRKVAIKLIRAEMIEPHERDEYLTRFQREARAAGRCMHPCIVAIYDFALHEDNPYLAMEFVEGANMAEALRARGPFAPDAAVAVMLQVLDALDCAHRIGVVHRDVKPANILLMPGDRVKMTDFGIARFDNSDLTQDGAMVGTPSYMSPEQCRGEEVDARTDLFSAGAVLYEMLSGTRAFAGRNSTEVTYRLMNEEPADIATLVGGMPPGLAAVLRRALAKPRQERFGSAREMAAALSGASAWPAGPAADATMIVSPAAARSAPPGTYPGAPQLGTTPGTALGPRGGTLPGTYAGTAPGTRLGTVVGTQGGTVMGTQAGITAAETQRAERALAEYLGPIAKLFVKRALQTAGTPQALWSTLAAHIEKDAERAAFLHKRDG
jgi:serine/threonine-protein kinase